MRRRFLTVAAVVLLAPSTLRAGGPAFVAGSGYNPGVEGQPLLWANASVTYYTDQGDLSPILPSAQADAFVAAAIAPWTSAPGVQFNATQAGHLAEDVNGSNIQAAQNGVITAPADITPTATSTPLGIVYDFDGSVTDALLGQGAGDLADCFTNAVYGGPDSFSASGNIVHAVAVINGVCAATTGQLPDVQYRLERVLARIFGLGWSQANLNVLTGEPPPSPDDYQGFPLMHFSDPVNCVPISVCYPNAAAPKLDDVTAFARLYPAPGGNPQPTGRIWGDLYFTIASGVATQPMQGVNVVARLLVNGQPSRRYVVTSVSGFEFVGNAGNTITGYLDSNGLPFNRFGSSDPTLEGFFDLGQLPIPSGQNVAQYQLSVEALDSDWSLGVAPYAPAQVAPSGAFSPVVVTVAPGTNQERDILMLDSGIAQSHPGSGSTYQSPTPLPLGGGWASWISGYGAADFFAFTAQANRTASVAVFALDENGQPTESKLLPIIGVWELSDQSGDPAPASTLSAFNSMTFGMSRLDVQFNSTEAYRLGVADYRGDGRPDYACQASVLYSDSVTPARLSLAGGATTLLGIGFRPGLTLTAGSNNGGVLTQSATQLEVILPSAALDGAANVQVTDPATGSFSLMQGALTYGAASSDLLRLLQGTEPATPVGAQAANPIRVRAVAADGVTPVNGATIAWTATNGVQFSACGGATSCSVLTDGAGKASTWITPTVSGTASITAALAPLSYSPPQTQQATLVASSSALDLAAIMPTRWIAQGATLAVPLTVEALDLGAPKAGVMVAFNVTNGSASLSSSSATTNSSGLATVTAQVTAIGSNVQVSACVSPGNNPCQTFTLFATPSSMWTIEIVGGDSQIVPMGQAFQSLAVRVTDGTPADDPVLGVSVTFTTTLERNPQGPGGGQQGDAMEGNGGSPVILATYTTQVVTDQNGLASTTPSVGSLGPCDVYIVVTAGRASAQVALESVPGIPNAQPPIKSRGTRGLGHQSQVVLQDVGPQASPVAVELFAQELPAFEPAGSPCSATASDGAQGTDASPEEKRICAPAEPEPAPSSSGALTPDPPPATSKGDQAPPEPPPTSSREPGDVESPR